jgi:hypothetical protein
MRGFLVLLIALSSCNPVKQVLKSPEKFAIIKDTVISRGYCKSDTLTLYSSDTTYLHDTTTLVFVDTAVIKDSVYFYETKFQTITKKVTIRDSVKSVVIDSALVQVLRKEKDIAINREQVAMTDIKKLRKMLQLGAAGALIFFLLLFKLK